MIVEGWKRATKRNFQVLVLYVLLYLESQVRCQMKDEKSGNISPGLAGDDTLTL